uniref:Atp-binding cassette superfamily n=1 Tax=Tetraselmis sp. GSL018 TaxID=582737 RepID=A0A061R5T1_9CHLO
MAQLEWRNVKYELPNGKRILDDVSGVAKAGHLLAILGPSGAGKTSLLKLIAKRLPKQRGATVTGHLDFVQPDAAGPAGEVQVAFVAQDTAFFSNLTVWETVLLSAKLRSEGSDAKVERAAEALLSSLGLTECMHTYVGGDTGGREVAGISGGEKRRLAIACELAGDAGAGAQGVLLESRPRASTPSRRTSWWPS